MHSLVYLFAGLDGYGKLVPWMWAFAVASVVALVLLIVPATRRKEDTLLVACVFVIIATWIDKGLGLVIGGFIPDPFDKVFEYWPTTPEILIALGVWATGFFVLTVLFKMAVSIKEEVGA